MAVLGNISTINVNGNELTIKDAALTEIVEEIIEAIGANNGDISERINNLHERSFDALIKISSQNESEIASISDGIYKLQYVSTNNEEETLNNSAILIQQGTNQYLYKDGQLHSRIKTENVWSAWKSFEGGVTSVNGQTGAVTINVGVTSFNGSTGAVTYTAPVTSVNGQTGTVSLALGDTNVIETIKVNNTALTPVSKAVNITVPTKVSDLTNDSNFTSNTGTITGITMNGVSKGTSGVVNLGTVLTEHQDISGKVDKVTGMGLSSNDYTTAEKNKLAGINIGSLDSLTTTELNSIFS